MPPPIADVTVRKFGANKSRSSSLFEWHTKTSAAVGLSLHSVVVQLAFPHQETDPNDAS
jgi:hypothetical protein